jgi:hypothetical protein
MFTRFLDPETESFAQDPFFMVIALPSTDLNDPALTLTSDEVWGDDKLLHLSVLPVTDTGEVPLSPICGTVGSEYISGLYPTPIAGSILKTPLVWCLNGDVDFWGWISSTQDVKRWRNHGMARRERPK